MLHLSPRRLRAVLAGIIALSLAAACGSGSRRARAADPATYVEMRNQGWLDQNVYVLRSGQRIRLGTVTGGATQRFRIPPSLLFGPTPLSFVADPIGSPRQATSMEITVVPGETVTLTIPPG